MAPTRDIKLGLRFFLLHNTFITRLLITNQNKKRSICNIAANIVVQKLGKHFKVVLSLGQQIKKMDFTLLDIISVTGLSATKAIILLLFTPGKSIVNLTAGEEVKIKKYMESIKGIKNRREAEEMVLLIMNDSFTKETKTAGRNLNFIKKLATLKQECIDFYLQSLQDNSAKNSDLKYNCDIHSTIGLYLLQIMRFRLVIQPEVQITVNVHKQTKIVYLTVKGFWLNDDGVKERKFSRSIGRADEYKLGKDDPKAIEDGTTKMQEILYEEYLKYYSKK